MNKENPKELPEWEEELKKLIDNPRTGLKESSNTNKTRYAILDLFSQALITKKGEEWRKAYQTGYDEALTNERERLEDRINKIEKFRCTDMGNNSENYVVVRKEDFESIIRNPLK